MLSLQQEVNTLEEKSLFQQILSFTSAVMEVKHALTKDNHIEHVTPVQYKILEHIMVSQPVTPSEISECQQISMPNTSRELRKLQALALIEKTTDPTDRRKQCIQLSTDGEQKMRAAFADVEKAIFQRLADISAKEQQQLSEAMQLLQQKLFY